MSAKLLLRIAAGLVLFFAVGHSVGHFTRKSTTEPEAQAVFKGITCLATSLIVITAMIKLKAA